MNTNDHVRSVFFDVDGTLFDTLPSLAAAANELLQQAGLLPVEPEVLRPALSEGLPALFRSALSHQRRTVPDTLAQRLEAGFAEHYATQWLHKAAVFEGVPDLLAVLRALDIPLGICTNRDRSSTEALLEGAAFHRFFEVIVCLGDAANAKPDPAPLRLAMQQLGAAPSSSLFVGDSGVDAACAHAADVRLAAHLHGYAASVNELRPCAIAFSRYSELGVWISEHAIRPTEAAKHG